MSLREMPVREVMTVDVVTFRPDDNVKDAIKAARDRVRAENGWVMDAYLLRKARS